MRCFRADHLLKPTILTPVSPNADSQTLPSLYLNSRIDPTSTTSSGSLCLPFTSRMTNNLLLKLVVTCSRKVDSPFPLSVPFLLIRNEASADPAHRSEPQ